MKERKEQILSLLFQFNMKKLQAKFGDATDLRMLVLLWTNFLCLGNHR